MSTALVEGCVAGCPGCAHRGWTRAESLAQKQRFLASRLAPWAEQLSAVASVTEPQRWRYRDRIQLASEWSPTDGWQFGLRQRDQLIAIHHCPVQSRRASALIALLNEQLPPPSSGLALSYLVQSGAQAVLVLKQTTAPPTPWLDGAVQQRLADLGLEGLWLHCHPAAGKKVFTKNGWHLIWGQPRSLDSQGLCYGPAAFQQLLPVLFGQALDQAERFLAPGPGSRVLDLYCGSGSSLKRWLNRGGETMGVEIGAEALACAAINAPTAELLRGSCRHRLPQLQQWSKHDSEGERLLYTNPPRTGMEREVTHWVGNHYRPQRIAYLSCSAGTLASDLGQLERAGYRVEQLAPYDFFPHTLHVETLALLSRSRK